MKLRPFCRTSGIPAAIILCVTACATDSGGSGTAGTSGGATTSATTSATSGATTGGGLPADCSDDYDGNQSAANAHPLGLDTTDTVQGVFGDGTVSGDGNELGGDELVVCSGQPDFFTFETACPGFLAVEVIRLDDEVVEATEGLIVRDPDGELDLLFYENESMTVTARADGSQSSYYLKPLNRYVGGGPHTIEVRHRSSDPQEYQLQVTFLPAGTCATAEWACEATSSLTATETACSSAPVSGACPGGAVTSSSIALPSFTDGMTQTDGWVVQTSAAGVRNINSLTDQDRDAIAARCVAACEREWSDRPAVSATCSAAEAFEPPRRLGTPSQAALQLIPSAQTNGAGLFGTQTLSCDLHDDCCEAFDESLCAAAPSRVTPAGAPLGRGVETDYDIDSSSSTLTVTDGATTDDVALYGNVGVSECTAGSATTPCPFYVGSLEAKSIGQAKIPITCPWGTTNRTLYNVDIDLAQPAFGIAQGGTDRVAFPPGALVFDATFKRNVEEITVRGANQVPVYATVGGSAIVFDTISVTGVMPGCFSSDEVPVDGEFDIALDLGASPNASPPTIALSLPGSVSCPSSLSLTATTSDPDNDIDTVRWYVDDVLLDASTTSITVDSAHTIQAVVYDARGAAATALHEIDCN